MKMKIINSIAGCWIACFWLSTAATAAPLNEARVSQAFQDVKLLAPNAQPRPAVLNDSVHLGSAVRTGGQSRAELTFQDLTITRLGENTVFTIKEGGRDLNLEKGSVLLQVPSGAASANIRTAAVTAAVSGGTAMFGMGPPMKFMVLEGVGTFYPAGHPDQAVTLHGGEMMTLTSDGHVQVATFDVKHVLETSPLVTQFPDLANLPLILDVQQQQTAQTSPGSSPPPSKDTNDVTSQNTAANPAANPTGPTTNEFGPPSTITTPDPYVIGPGTTIQTDPTITSNGVTDQGKIYRSFADDGSVPQFLFGEAPTAFDQLVFDNSGSSNYAVFKFSHLQLVSDPTIIIPSGATANLALVSVGDITSGGSTAVVGAAALPPNVLTFAGIQKLDFITQNGSITLGPDISFSGIPHLSFYARGTNSNVTLGSDVTSNGVLKLWAQNNIEVDSSVQIGDFFAYAGGDFSTGKSANIDTGNINITANNLNFTTANFAPGEHLINSVTLAGMTAVNIDTTSNTTVFGAVSGSVNVSAPTINLTGGNTIGFYNGATATFTAGTGGIQGSTVTLQGQGGSISLSSNGDINIFSVTNSNGDVEILDGSISAPNGSFMAGGNVGTGTFSIGNDVTMGGYLHARSIDVGGSITVDDGILALGGSITAGGDIYTGGNLELRVDENNHFGNITAGGNITANIISTPGDPATVSSGGTIRATSVLTGTLHADMDIFVGDTTFDGGYVIANTVTAGGTLTLTNISSISPNNGGSTGTDGETFNDFTLTVGSIVSNGPNFPTLSSNGGDANPDDATSNPGNGGNITVNITAAGLTVGDGMNLASIQANGGAFNGQAEGGGNGGHIDITAAGDVDIAASKNGPTIFASTGVVPDDSFNVSGHGGTVNITTSGAITVEGTIQVSSDDARTAPDAAGRESASGGVIDLQSNATTGNGIAIGATGQLLSLLGTNASGPGGSITLSTQGANIVVNGTVEADRGSITMDQNDPAGLTPSITIDGATIIGDSLTINGAGTVSIGSGSSSTISVNTFSITAPGAIEYDDNNGLDVGEFDIASTAGGNVTLTEGENLNLNGKASFQTTVPTGAMMDGANVTANISGNYENDSTTDSSLFQVTNLGHVGTGGNVAVTINGNLTATGLGSATAFPEPGDVELLVQNTNGQIDTGGNVNLTVGGNVNVNGLAVYVQNYDDTAHPAGQIGTGGNIDVEVSGNLNANSYVDVFLNNRGGGTITSGGNLTFNVTGDLTIGSDTGGTGLAGFGAEFVISNRYDDSAGNTAPSTIGSSVALYVHASSILIAGDLFGSGISNRGGSTIGGDATATWDVSGNLTIQGNGSTTSFGGGFGQNWFILNDAVHDGAATLTSPPGGTINGNAALALTIGGDVNIASDASVFIGNQRSRLNTAASGGSITGDATINISATNFSVGGEFDVFIRNDNAGSGTGDGGSIGGLATINLTLGGALSLTGDDINSSGQPGLFDVEILNHGANGNTTGGSIGSNASITVQANSISTGDFFAQISNSNGGSIGGGATVQITTATPAPSPIPGTGNVSAGSLTAQIDNRNYSGAGGGAIGGNVAVGLTAGGPVSLQGTGFFGILNDDEGNLGASGGTISGSAGISVTGTSFSSGSSSGWSLLALIDNRGGTIAGDSSVSFILSGDLDTQGDARFQVYNYNDGGANGGLITGSAGVGVQARDITSSGAFTASLINDSGIIQGGAAVSVGARNLSTGTSDLNLYITNQSGTIDGPASVTYVGSGDITASNNSSFEILNYPHTAGGMGGAIGNDATVDVGAVNINATNQLLVQIDNTNGGISGDAAVILNATGNVSAGLAQFRILNDGTAGGSIDGNASVSVTAGSMSVGSLEVVIDNSQGSITGDANIGMNVAGTATVTNDATVAIYGSDPGGSAGITFTGGNYNVTGNFRSTIDGNGTIKFTNADISAATIKVGAFGTNGALMIGGGSMTANQLLKLYATGSNGSIEFTANVRLNCAATAIILAANKITIDQNVVVTIAGSFPASVYATIANYSSVYGGNDTNGTYGTFAGAGATNPQSGNPPPFDNPAIAPATAKRSSAVTGPSSARGLSRGLQGSSSTTIASSSSVSAASHRAHRSSLSDGLRQSATSVTGANATASASSSPINVADSGQLLSVLDSATPGSNGKVLIASSKQKGVSNAPIRAAPSHPNPAPALSHGRSADQNRSSSSNNTVALLDRTHPLAR